MLIGHLPAGYLAARLSGVRGALFAGMIVGAVLPDIDMLWFHLVDHRAVHHHAYLTHRPLVWAVALLTGLALRRRFVAGLGLGGLVHMAMDTIAGAIAWGWPLWPAPVTLVTVPATHDHWIASFLAHWTFRLELAITGAALAVLLYRLNRGRRG